MAETAIEIRELVSGYGRVQVLREVTISAARGEMTAIIGSNGAGKSTLLKTVAGLLKPWSGSVTIEGEAVTGLPAERLVRRGVALVPEGRMLFGGMSVRENLRLGAYARPAGGSGREFDDDVQRAVSLFPVLGERMGQTAATLSGGEQQMLAVARALMSRPRVLLLDEPSLGLAPKVIAEIFAALDELRAEGLSILLVEQDAQVALRHADSGHVMRTGEVALSGRADELLADDDVRLIYLGAWHDGHLEVRDE